MIAQELHAIQHRHGFLPKSELRALAARTGTKLHRIQEVASFFPHFRLDSPPPIQISICQDLSCQLRGACETIGSLQRLAESSPVPIDVQGVSCLGRCDRAPVAYVASRIGLPSPETHDGSTDSHAAQEIVNYYADADLPKMKSVLKQTFRALKKGDVAGLPKTETDHDWQPNQTQDWSIDVYQNEPDENCYQCVRQFIDRFNDDTPSADWHIDTDIKESVEKALRGSLDGMDSERQRIICALSTANLLGMGGAGGRAYKKWFEVYQALGDIKYVVCNGDESEPGTFKDRELLLRAPHLVVEGVILGGLLIGAGKGYIYIRHEYEEQIEAVRNEIERAKRLRICGENILGSGMNFDVEVFVSPGGYICGEQTALIEAMEDKRAEPRNRPPELQTNGLWDCPTLLNNVETLAWVPAILLKEDGHWFASQGEEPKYLGRRFFSISGDVAKPGAYEVPIGLTLRQLIDDYAGGMVEEKRFKAAALSGPSGGFVPRLIPVNYLPEKYVAESLPAETTHFDILDMKLDIPTSRKMGIMMGAGIVIFAEGTDMVATALSASTFYRNESCGKCVPCRIGSQKLVELLTDIANQKYSMNEIYGSEGKTDVEVKRGLIDALSETMKLTAICGLGTVASNPVTTLLDHFQDDVSKYAKPAKS